MRKLPLALSAVAALLLAPSYLAAQDEEAEPDTRIVTVTSAHVPFGDAGQAFMDFVDAYIVPPSLADPNILAFRVLRHAWGTNKVNFYLVAEYESFTTMDVSNEWQDAWFEENYPEGSDERAEADRATEEDFLPLWSTHTDNILGVRMDRAKD